MAERRMFAKTIIDSDAFLDMPMSARLLYYDLSMRADDDGFVNAPKKILKFTGATIQDMQVLISNRFIIPFEDKGVVVIKHWFIHNYIRKDMYHETKYKEEKALLNRDENGAYTLSDCSLQACNEPVTSMDTQVRLGKDRLGKYRLGEEKECSLAAEVIKYFNEKTGRQYNPNSNGVVQNLLTRIREGHTLDEFRHVIDVKVDEWSGTKMDAQIRPSVLFGNHFDEYLNQDIKKPKEDEYAGQRDGWSSEFFPE